MVYKIYYGVNTPVFCTRKLTFLLYKRSRLCYSVVSVSSSVYLSVTYVLWPNGASYGKNCLKKQKRNGLWGIEW